jgi:hypothetical protein
MSFFFNFLLTNNCFKNPARFSLVSLKLAFLSLCTPLCPDGMQQQTKLRWESLCVCVFVLGGFSEVFKCANHTPFLLVTRKCVTYLLRVRVCARG